MSKLISVRLNREIARLQPRDVQSAKQFRPAARIIRQRAMEPFVRGSRSAGRPAWPPPRLPALATSMSGTVISTSGLRRAARPTPGTAPTPSRRAAASSSTNGNGAIEATQATDGKLTVHAERIAKASSDEAAKQLLAKIEIVESVKPDAVRLETRAPKGFMRGGAEVKLTR